MLKCLGNNSFGVSDRIAEMQRIALDINPNITALEEADLIADLLGPETHSPRQATAKQVPGKGRAGDANITPLLPRQSTCLRQPLSIANG